MGLQVRAGFLDTEGTPILRPGSQGPARSEAFRSFLASTRATTQTPMTAAIIADLPIPGSTSPVPAETARRLGAGLLREAMALRSQMSLASYDRLFPSQDLLPAGGMGNLIAAPLFRPARDRGATLFLDLVIRADRRLKP